ncbi:MAG TPA: ATP-binding protein [Clostridia bacterium]
MTKNFLHMQYEDMPYLLCDNDIVIAAGEAFINLTGYSRPEILNRSISDILSNLLRINCDVHNLNHTCDTESYFLFTKSFSLREVNIHVQNYKKADSKIYILVEKVFPELLTLLPFIKQLYNDNHYGIAIYSSKDFILLEANSKYLELFCEPLNKKENCLGLPFKKLISDFEGSKPEKVWNKIVHSGETVYLKEFEGSVGGMKGKYWDNTLNPVMIDGEVKFIVSMLVEVTEKVISRSKQIIPQKNPFEAVIENMNDAIAILDSKGNIILTNAEARKMYPYISSNSNLRDVYDELLCLDINNSKIPFDSLPSVRALMGHTVRNERVTIKSHDRVSTIEVNAVPIFDAEGNFVAAVVSHRDISATVKFERQLKEQKDLLQSILDTSSADIFIVDTNAKSTLMNNIMDREILASFDYSDDTFAKTKYYYMDGSEIPIERMAAKRIMRKEVIKDEIIRIVVRDEEHFLLVNGIPLFDENNNFLYGVISSREITKFLRNEQALKEAQERLLIAECAKNDALKNAIEMKDEFISLISHEFKTPLTVINSAIQAMNFICKDELSDKSKGFLDKILQSSHRQLKLVNNLLDITRADAGHLKVNKTNIDIVQLTRSITESIRVFAEQKSIKLSFSSSIRKKVIGIDIEKFDRILLNLLSNAVKYTPEGKSIEVNLSLKDIKGKRRLCVQVEDNGFGIPADKKDLIFERFGQVDRSLTKQAEGTGIGLYLTKMLVGLLGGEIKLESELGIGSKFTIILPIEKAKEIKTAKTIGGISDYRLIQATAIEFSDFYITSNTHKDI